MSGEFVLEISTRISPPKKFTIDGTEYELFSTDHLSPEQEAEVSALFARHSLLVQQLEMTPNTTAGKKIALQVQGARKKIICSLTTVPADMKLPLAAQGALIRAITDEIDGPDEDDVPAAPDAEEVEE